MSVERRSPAGSAGVRRSGPTQEDAATFGRGSLTAKVLCMMARTYGRHGAHYSGNGSLAQRLRRSPEERKLHTASRITSKSN